MLNAKPEELPSSGSSDRPKLEAGTYPAVITLLLDLGMQESKKYQSEEMQVKHELWVSFTLPTERYESEGDDGTKVERDQILGKRYTFSNNEKAALMALFNTVCNKGDTFANMLGAQCMVTVGTTANGNPKVSGVVKLPRGMQVGEPLNAPLAIGEDQWDGLDNIDLPPFLKEMVAARVK